MLKITLPWPPTLNTYYRSSVFPSNKDVMAVIAATRNGPSAVMKALRRLAPRTMISAKGREYRLAAAGEMLVQGVVMRGLTDNLAVHIKAYPPDRRKRDLDNLPKGVLDALTKAEVWQDDSQIDDLRITRGHIVKGGLLEITIQPMG